MKWWQILLMGILPTVRMSAELFKNQDENTTGRDDLIGVSLAYGADLLEWAVSPRTPQPPAPPSVLAQLKQ